MSNLFSGLLKIIIYISFVGGAAILLKENFNNEWFAEQPTNKKAIALRNHLLKYKKPKIIKFNNLTKRLAADAAEVQKIKMDFVADAGFYISIDLFTDENDPEAPLVAQIQFIDVASENKLKEESINLD